MFMADHHHRKKHVLFLGSKTLKNHVAHPSVDKTVYLSSITPLILEKQFDCG